jgi:hypothetical protein
MHRARALILAVVASLAFGEDSTPAVADTEATAPALSPAAVAAAPAVRLLVMRPVNAYGVAVRQDKWLLLLCESHIHFRLNGVPGVDVVSPELLAGLIPGYDDFDTAVSQDLYAKAAKSLSVPYILYVECSYSAFSDGTQIRLGQEVGLTLELSKVGGSTSLAVESRRLRLNRLGKTIDHFLVAMLDSMRVAAEEQNRPFLARPVQSTKTKLIRAMGEALASPNAGGDEEWQKSLNRYKTLLHRDPLMVLGYYVGMQFCAAAGRYEDAAHFSYDLLAEFGPAYPKAYLSTIRYYQAAKKCDDANRIAELARNVASVRDEVGRVLGECADMGSEMIRLEKGPE